MSRRRDLEARLHSLTEIHEILGAMRGLAFTETHRIAGFLDTQRRAFAGMETAMADLLGWHNPEALVSVRPLMLVIGSEGGFCGDFNESVQRGLTGQPAGENGDAHIVVVGQRLANRLVDDPRVVARFDGPATVDEVETVLLRLTAWFGSQPLHSLRLTVLHQSAETGAPGLSVFQPFATDVPSRRYSHPPRLNLPPPLLLAQLADHYLFAALHAVFYESLAAKSSAPATPGLRHAPSQRYYRSTAFTAQSPAAGRNHQRN